VELEQAELEALADRIAQKTAEQTRAEIFSLLGFNDDDKGRESLKELGDLARLFKDFNHELRKKSISGVISTVGWIVKLTIIGAIAYCAIKLGVTIK